MTDIRFTNILQLDDAIKEKVREWRNSGRVRHFMLTQHVISAHEHTKWVDGLKRGDNALFWVVFAGDDPIGAAYLHNINKEKKTSEWGFYIGNDAYTGKGLGKNILFKLLETSFDEMGFEVLLTKAFSDNIAALSLYRKFDFAEKGREALDGKRDVILLEFTKDDWSKVRGKLSSEPYSENRQ
ncbi:MAG: UDP-4-amino-4,6-dideoxy-N-acetyl-beta-L-altrosamine N-acetyltransferase [Candidatus Omnitrophica bacterium]|nr:UDP-4-amino-4,6-dideoxy-N-acetyl-beta-L-altrosamine N-acetyltransferase [Candidatus Omnitrophota bacterium]